MSVAEQDPEQARSKRTWHPLALLAQELGVHVGTLHRWRLEGLLVQDGTRKFFEPSRIGGRWMARRSDLDSFLAALNGKPRELATPPLRSTLARRRDAERAERELDAILHPSR